MERRTRRCPAACSSPVFASWIAGFFSSVVCRTVSSVTALVGCAKQAIKIAMESFGVASCQKRSTRHSEKHRLAACTPQREKSLFHHWLSFAGGRATSETCAALGFSFFAFLILDPKSSASAELAQACARRARATLCK